MEKNAEGFSNRSIMNSLIALLAAISCFTSPGLSKPTYSGAHGGYSAIQGGYGGFAAGGGPDYHGPQALPVVLPDGHLADTPEVAAAKGAHYAALAKASAEAGPHDGGYNDGAGAVGYGFGGTVAGGYGYGGDGAVGYGNGGGGYGGAYHGPLASPTVLSSGYLADTHEVAALRGAHLTALSAASAVGGAGYAGGYGGVHGGGYGRGGYGGGYGGGATGGYGGGAAGGYGGYRGPLAIPVVLPSGHIADTHEVAAAKTAHLNAVAQSSARSAAHGYYGYHH